jgi:[ribosomal protein S5]-alanine N-acetyltransferase
MTRTTLPTPTLHTARLRLRPFADTDAGDLFALHSNARVLRYCFAEAAWGRGYATEAAGALLGWAFDTLDLNRVQAETDTRNLASARVLEKLGFVREGTLREDCVVNGEVSDSWVYGLLRRERRPLPGPAPAR